MKKLLIGCLLLCAAGCVRRATRFRSGFRDCTSAGGGAILCGGKPAAQVECFQPRSNSCRALAVRYTDGERVWLYQPMGFDPDQPEASAANAEDDIVVVQPEMARDASLIWFRRSDGPRGYWQTYEPLTGIFDEVDTMKILSLRRRSYDAPIQLWSTQ